MATNNETTAHNDFETIQTETRGRVGIITLDRPKALNALNQQLMLEIISAAQEFDGADGIGCIVLTGSEKAFAAGADLAAAVTDITLNPDPSARIREWLETAP